MPFQDPEEPTFLEPKDFIYATAAKLIAYADVLPSYRALHDTISRRITTNRNPVLSVGPLKINTDTRIIHYNDIVLNFNPRETTLLICLGRMTGKIVEKEQIIYSVWGQSHYQGSHAIDTTVSRIRNMLKKYDLEWMLETVRGQGYILHKKKPALSSGDALI